MPDNFKVAVLSYPMLFQRQGGLQIQILETIAALRRLGIQAELINPNQDKLADYDLVHVFSAINGNYRLVEAARHAAKPVVISPLVQPDWTKCTGLRERSLDRLVGKLTGWHIQTTYREIEFCLQSSDFVVALGEIEKKSIMDAFHIAPEKIRVIQNGIPQRFFEASPDLFIEKYTLAPGFVLCVAAINNYKNQLTLVQALKDEPCKIVLIGQCLETDQGYLDKILEFPNVIYLGSLDYQDPLLASAYAAAGVFCLPSQSEVMPLSVLEALASGTPAIMTKHHCMNVGSMHQVLAEIEPNNHEQIRLLVNRVLANPVSSDQCRNAVLHLNWDNVAQDLSDMYRALIR